MTGNSKNETIVAADPCDLSHYDRDKYWKYPRECMTVSQYCNATFHQFGRRPIQCGFDTLHIARSHALVMIILAIGVVACVQIRATNRLSAEEEDVDDNDHEGPPPSRREQQVSTSWWKMVRSTTRAEFAEKMECELRTLDAKDHLRETTNANSRRRDRFDVHRGDGDDHDEGGEAESEFSSCAICLSDFHTQDDEAELARSFRHDVCRHVFHKRCVIEWLATARDPTCPCCRCYLIDRERLEAMNVFVKEKI